MAKGKAKKAEGPKTDPVAVAALCRCLPSKQVKDAEAAVADGSTARVKLTAEVDAIVTRSAPTRRTPTVNLLSKGVIAELVRRLGATRASFHHHLLELATELVIQERMVADDLVKHNEELLHAAKEVEDQLIAKLPKVKRRGQLSVKAETRFAAIERP